MLALLSLTLASTASAAPAGAAWTGQSAQQFAWYGWSVASCGDLDGDGYDDVAVGALRYDNPEDSEGAVAIYAGGPSGLPAAPSWVLEIDIGGSQFGSTVARAGDVNGDGFDDLLVGASKYGNGQYDEGAVALFLGSATGPGAAPVWGMESNQSSAFLDRAAGAGDVNGDGFDDVVVGGSSMSNGETNEGMLFVYLGSAAGLAAAPDWTAESNIAGARLGNAVASAGDVNGDGYDDLVAGAYRYSNGEATEGAAFLYLGSASGLAAAPAWQYESNQVLAFFGTDVDSAGDVNSDGYDDVIIGAQSWDAGQPDEGGAWLFLGSASGLEITAAWTAEADQANARLGTAVSRAGDVDGDGFDDVVITAPNYRASIALRHGAAAVYLGSATGLGAAPAAIMLSDEAGTSYGQSVSGGGDVDGDGLDDVIVGAPFYSLTMDFDTGGNWGPAKEGAAFLFLGR